MQPSDKKEKNIKNAAVLVIGNEILSGRTHESNMQHLAAELTGMGISLMEARVVADDEKAIIEAVNTLRKKYDYVFTTGGIGPTHDDITTAAIAKAFKVKAKCNAEAFRRLEKHYEGGTQSFNEARQKMANIPEGGKLIDNPISAAPGYQLENVYVMAGVPVIMKAMFDFIRGSLKTGKPMLSETISTDLTEGTIATELGRIQKNHPEVDIGSYPHIKDGKLGVALVVRSRDKNAIKDTLAPIRKLIKQNGGKVFEK